MSRATDLGHEPNSSAELGHVPRRAESGYVPRESGHVPGNWPADCHRPRVVRPAENTTRARLAFRLLPARQQAGGHSILGSGPARFAAGPRCLIYAPTPADPVASK